MKNRRQQNSPTIFRLLAGWCGLMLYVVAFSPVGMGVAAVLGTLDPDHRAFLQPGDIGMRLVLHHDVVCVSHKHHAVARALNLFAQPAGEADPDHIVQFAGGDGFWRDTQAALGSEDLLEQPAVATAFSVLLNTYRVVRSLPPTDPPPDVVGNLLNIRSTVLLI